MLENLIIGVTVAILSILLTVFVQWWRDRFRYEITLDSVFPVRDNLQIVVAYTNQTKDCIIVEGMDLEISRKPWNLWTFFPTSHRLICTWDKTQYPVAEVPPKATRLLQVRFDPKDLSADEKKLERIKDFCGKWPSIYKFDVMRFRVEVKYRNKLKFTKWTLSEPNVREFVRKKHEQSLMDLKS